MFFAIVTSRQLLTCLQVWFVGPIALHAGEVPFGGDVGFELGFLFASVSYLAFRTIELKFFGR